MVCSKPHHGKLPVLRTTPTFARRVPSPVQPGLSFSMAKTSPWDDFHSAWRRVETALRTSNGNSLRGPINEIIEAAARSRRIEPAVAAELDAFRRLRNLDSHEGLAGSGGHLCTPSDETVCRVKDIADQLECPLAAIAVMEKAASCTANTTLGDVVAKLRSGAQVVYYRDKGTWCAFDRHQVSRIVERNAKGATTTLDLQRSIADHTAKIGSVTAPLVERGATARRALAALRATITADDEWLHQSVICIDGRTVWHLCASRADEVERRLAT